MILHLGGQYSFYLPGHPNQVELDINGPTRLVDVLEQLGIPAAEIGLTVINGELAELSSAQVTQEDVVKLYPPVSGG